MFKTTALLLLSLGAANAVRIHPKNDHSFCLAALRGPYAGAEVIIEKCVDGAWYQQWEVGGASTAFKIKDHSGTEFCAAPGYQMNERVNGLKVVLTQCPKNLEGYHWHPSSNSVNEGQWSFENTMFCLDNRENKLEDNNPVQIWSCAKEVDTVNQSWDFTD